jgi:hypothetical protein
MSNIKPPNKYEEPIPIPWLKKVVLQDVWDQQLADKPRQEIERIIQSDMIESLNLDVNPAIKAIYTNWQSDYRTRFNALLANQLNRAGSTLTEAQRTITETGMSLPDCTNDLSQLSQQEIDDAYHAVALELQSYYDRLDDEDEAPLWCPFVGCMG